MVSELPAGWYDDPTQEGRLRYWDGAVWTQQVRPESTTSEPPGHGQPAPSPSTGERSKGRGRTLLLIGGLAVLVVAAIAAVVVVLEPFGDDELDVADGSQQTAENEPEPESEGPGAEGEQAQADQDPDPDPAGVPLGQVDLDAAELRIDHGAGPVTVVLRDGEGLLDDGRLVRRVPELTVRSDVTGNGAEEIVMVLVVERSAADAEVPAIAVLTDDPDVGASSLEPPLLELPERGGTWSSIDDGFVEAISVHDGGIEVALIAALPGNDTLVFTDERADPLVENRRPEIRLSYRNGDWSAEADGPVTRAAADFAARAGFSVEELMCSGRAFDRGGNPTCIGLSMDDSSDVVEVSLLIVDDTGGFRGSTGRPAPVSSAHEVRRILGPGEYFCRDIAEQADSDDFPWELPMAAVAYWFDDGMPERMDASQNGIPCQTVFDDVAAFLLGTDGSVEPYDAVLNR